MIKKINISVAAPNSFFYTLDINYNKIHCELAINPHTYKTAYSIYKNNGLMATNIGDTDKMFKEIREVIKTSPTLDCI